MRGPKESCWTWAPTQVLNGHWAAGKPANPPDDGMCTTALLYSDLRKTGRIEADAAGMRGGYRGGIDSRRRESSPMVDREALELAAGQKRVELAESGAAESP